MHATLMIEQGSGVGTSRSVRPGQTLVMGAGPGAQLVLADAELQPRHAAVTLGPGGLSLVDLGGAAGTTVNGQRLAAHEPTQVRVGDAIGLGAHVVRVDGEGLEVTPITDPADAVVGPPGHELAGRVGRGGMGQVFAARRSADGAKVAIKVLHGGADPDSDEVLRFAREGSLAARVRSPFVVQVFEVGVSAGRAFIVMELVPGPSVVELLKRGPLTVPDALRIAEDVAEALAAAHEVDIVHRDVKPANILLSPEGVAKLTDFGLAKDVSGAARSLTGTGHGMGTLAYLAPEQFTDAKRAGKAADVYSLGATLYHLLAGRPPFHLTTPESLVQLLAKAPPPLGAARPDCPHEVVELVHLALAKEPRERGADAPTLATQLRVMRNRRYPGWSPELLFRGT